MADVPQTYDEAKRKAEACRAKAVARREAIAEQERMHRALLRSYLRKHWWQLWKPVDFERLHFPFDTLVDRNCAVDPTFRLHVGDVQWFLSWASMYAQGEQRDELRKLSGRLSMPVRTSGRTARADDPSAPPSQRVQRS